MKIWPVLGMWPGFGVLSSLQMGALGMGKAMGEPSPAAVPSANGGRAKIPINGQEKNVLPQQAGIHSWAVISSLPPSILLSSPSSALLTTNPDQEALSSPAVGAGGPEQPLLLSGVLIQCQGRKGSLWVSCAAAQTLSSDIFPALAPPCPGGLMF